MKIDILENKLNEVPSGYEDLFIYVFQTKEIIMIAEGSGGNLYQEEIEEGFIDYIYYTQYSLDSEMEEVDGGMVMLREYFQDKYNCTADSVEDVLDMAYGNKELNYIILK